MASQDSRHSHICKDAVTVLAFLVYAFALFLSSTLVGSGNTVWGQDHSSGGHTSDSHSSSSHSGGHSSSHSNHEGGSSGSKHGAGRGRGWPHSLVTDPRIIRGTEKSGSGTSLEDNIFRGGGRPGDKGRPEGVGPSASHDSENHSDEESSHEDSTHDKKGPPPGKGPSASHESDSHDHEDSSHDH
jgi:hypothetical protein